MNLWSQVVQRVDCNYHSRTNKTFEMHYNSNNISENLRAGKIWKRNSDALILFIALELVLKYKPIKLKVAYRK